MNGMQEQVTKAADTSFVEPSSQAECLIRIKQCKQVLEEIHAQITRNNEDERSTRALHGKRLHVRDELRKLQVWQQQEIERREAERTRRSIEAAKRKALMDALAPREVGECYRRMKEGMTGLNVIIEGLATENANLLAALEWIAAEEILDHEKLVAEMRRVANEAILKAQPRKDKA